jgi:hypothetical protein
MEVYMLTLSVRAQKLIAAFVVLALVAATAHFVPALEQFDLSTRGLPGFLLAFVFTATSYAFGQFLHGFFRLPAWIENSFSMSGTFPSWWLASLFFPAYVTLTGPLVASTALCVCALVAFDYVLHSVRVMNNS